MSIALIVLASVGWTFFILVAIHSGKVIDAQGRTIFAQNQANRAQQLEMADKDRQLADLKRELIDLYGECYQKAVELERTKRKGRIAFN